MYKHTQRFRFLNDMDHWQRLYPKSQEDWHGVYPSHQADEWLGKALTTFHTFSEQYNGYFQNVINAKVPKDEQFDPGKITRACLKARYLRTLNEYWRPLGQIAEQRQIPHYRDILNNGTNEAQRHLNKLNDMPGVNGRLPGVLLYFDKVSLFRYCPYTNIIFVGMPYSLAADDNRDWMAIPHELGHYVYWNLGSSLTESRKKHEELGKRLEQCLRPSLVEQGIEPSLVDTLVKAFLVCQEEAFADIVGVWLSGQEFIESFKTLLVTSAGNVEDLKMDDGSHPVPWLRPYMRIYALDGDTSSIEREWDEFFELEFKSHISTLTIDISTLQTSTQALSRLKNKLKRNFVKDDLLEMLVPTPAEASKKKLKELYNKFEQMVLSDTLVSLDAEKSKSATKVFAQCLSKEVQNVLTDGQIGMAKPESAFAQLCALAHAHDHVKKGEKKPYEILLHPRILEGGFGHTHASTFTGCDEEGTCYPFWSPHRHPSETHQHY